MIFLLTSHTAPALATSQTPVLRGRALEIVDALKLMNQAASERLVKP